MKRVLGSLKKCIFLCIKVFLNVIYSYIITILFADGIMTIVEGLTEENIWKIICGIALCASAITGLYKVLICQDKVY